MKTIIEGTVPSDNGIPFWVGNEFTCTRCGGKFQLEQDDKLETSQTRVLHSEFRLAFKCPTPGCEADITAKFVWNAGQWQRI